MIFLFFAQNMFMFFLRYRVLLNGTENLFAETPLTSSATYMFVSNTIAYVE